MNHDCKTSLIARFFSLCLLKIINYCRFFQLHFSNSLIFHVEAHCVKSVHIRSYSGLYFPAFGLNTDRYGVSLRIQSECGKIRTRITPNTNTFHAVAIPFFEVLYTSLVKTRNKERNDFHTETNASKTSFYLLQLILVIDFYACSDKTGHCTVDF